MLKKAMRVVFTFLFFSIFTGVSLSADTISIHKPLKKTGLKKIFVKKMERVSPYSLVYNNEDGSITKEIALRQVNYRDAGGEYREISTKFRVNAAGLVENTENSIKSNFSQEAADEGIGFFTDTTKIKWHLKSVSAIDAQGMEIWSESRKGSRAKPSASSIYYPGIFANVDDTYEIRPAKVKNNIVINSRLILPGSGARYIVIKGSFKTGLMSELFVNGLAATGATEARGGFDIAVGGDIYGIDPLYIIDSAEKAAQGAPLAAAAQLQDPGFTRAKYVVEKKFDRVDVEIWLDADFLNSAKTVYPVYVDPSITVKSSFTQYFSQTYDAMIGTPYAYNYGKNTYTWAARSTATADTYRSLIRFGEVDAIPNTAIVRSAILKLYRDAYYIGSAGTQYIELRALTAPWTEGTGTDASPKTDGATWASRTAGTAWGTPGGDFLPDIECRTPIDAGGVVGFVNFNITKIVNAWVKGTIANNGLIIKVPDSVEGQNTQTYGQRFITYEATSFFPLVKINYFLGNNWKDYYEGSKAITVSNMYPYQNIYWPFQTSAIASFDLSVGGDATNIGPCRSYVQFDMSDLPKNVTVTAASVKLYLYYKMGNGTTVEMHRMTNYWDELGASWVSRTADDLWGAAGGDYDPTILSSYTFGNNPTHAYYSFAIDPAVVQGWANGNTLNAGVMFKVPTEGASNLGYTFYNFDVNDMIQAGPENYMPRLDITYTAATGFTPPELIKPTGGEVVDKNFNITFRMGSQSSLGDPFNLQYYIQFSPDNGASWAALVTTTAKANFYFWDTSAVPEGDLYKVRVCAYDGTSYSPYSTLAVPFSVRHAAVPLKIMSSAAAPSTLQAGDLVTVVMNIANSDPMPYRIMPTSLAVNQVAGGGALLSSLNSLIVLQPYGSGQFTWAYRTTSQGTINFTGMINALGGDGGGAYAVNNVDTNAPTKTANSLSNNVVILYSSPSASPTASPTSSATPTITITPITSLAEALDEFTLTWSTSGNGNWAYENTQSYYDNDAAQAGAIADSKYSTLYTTVTGPGTINFYWKVSSEDTYDYLTFYVDSTVNTKISGTTGGWLNINAPITSGAHTLRWTYSKDVSNGIGSDTGWVDKVVYSTPTPTSTRTATASSTPTATRTGTPTSA